MNMKFLIDTKSDPVLTKIFQDQKEKSTGFTERAIFLDAQRTKFRKEVTDYKKQVWDEIEARLRELRLLPEDSKTPSLSCSDDESQIFYNGEQEAHENCDCLLCQLKQLKERLGV